MKYFLIASLFLVGCGSKSSSEIVQVESDNQMVASASDSQFLPVAQAPNRLTKADRKRLNHDYPRTLERIDNTQPLTLQDIKNITRSGVSDAAIIYELHRTRSIFYLTPDDEEELKQAGVSNRVIQEMKATSDTSYGNHE